MITRMVNLTGMNLSGKAKTPEMVIVICGIRYSLPCTKVIDFVACRVTSKVLGIGAAQTYWGDVNKIKLCKRPAISSGVSEKQSIVYTSACIKPARIEKYHYDKTLMIIVLVIIGMKLKIVLINS